MLTADQELWLHTLETTDIPQTTGELHNLDTGGMCCLGIASLLFSTPSGPRRGLMGYEDEFNFPPASLRKVLNLTSESISRCVRWNDSDSLTFPEIAARIRKNPEVFFHRVESPDEIPALEAFIKEALL